MTSFCVLEVIVVQLYTRPRLIKEMTRFWGEIWNKQAKKKKTQKKTKDKNPEHSE